MALTAAKKASLAIRIVAARCLDPHSILGIAGTEEERARDGDTYLTAGSACLLSWADRAAALVKDSADVKAHLRNAAAELDAFTVQLPADGDVLSRLQAASHLLEHFASGVEPDDGDGPALPQPRCTCGFLELAGLIEEHVRRCYAAANALKGGVPSIEFQTFLIEDPNQFLAPFRVGGDADISVTPRLVSMSVEDTALNAIDLCQLAYVLFHELVCHAFQALRLGGSNPENAPVQCHWTEGWMDVLAFRLASQWASMRPHGWLPLSPADASDAIWKFHALRYVDRGKDHTSRVDKLTARYRRAARQAVEELEAAYSDNFLATREQAKKIVQEFLFKVNSHPDVDWQVLRRLSEALINSLLSEERRHQSVRIAAQCDRFIRDGDLVELQAGVLASARRTDVGLSRELSQG